MEFLFFDIVVKYKYHEDKQRKERNSKYHYGWKGTGKRWRIVLAMKHDHK